MEVEKIATGQKVIKLRQAQANIKAGQYDLSNPMTAEDFSSADEAGATEVYNQLIKFGNP
jgi:cell division protein YceG involved in septum cleavage